MRDGAGWLRGGPEGRLVPVVIALATVGLFLWLWGGLNPLPWVYDESAYLLQARIFAGLHWSVPGPPLPEFFEQFHVFVTPQLVPKYPPGHALLLVPGIWLRASALVPLLAGGLTGALLFTVGRRLGNAWVGLLAWAIWITAPEVMQFGPTFMAETTSTASWVVAWTLLARWRDTRGLRTLVGFSIAAAVAAVIRPVTAIALLAPAGLWIGWVAWRERRVRQVALAVAAALPVLALAPWWSHAVSGRVAPTPYSEYSRVYAPWNMPGFTIDTSPPVRGPTPALTKFRDRFLPIHEAHRLGRLPVILAERLEGVAITLFGPRGRHWRWLLAVAFLIGVIGASPPLRFGLMSAATLVVVYLWMAGRPLWTVYYLEVFPVLALVSATGCWWVLGWVERSSLARRWPAPGAWTGAAVLAALAAALPGTVTRFRHARAAQVDARADQAALQAAIDSIPGRAIVFVASGPPDAPYDSFVRNSPDLHRERVWVVDDRGADDQRLIDRAPDRAAYRYDPGPRRLVSLGNTSVRR